MVNAIRLPTSTPAAPLLHKRNIHVRKRRVSLAGFGYSGAMLLDSDACFRAVRARDRRFDGRFLHRRRLDRHLLPAHLPGAAAEAREHALFFERGGGRGRGIPALPALPPGARAGPCERSTRPSRLAGAAIAGIEEHALSNARVGDLAASLGVSDRHLRRVTEAELGVSPIELAQTQRLLLAKRLLGETSLNLTDIAFASGFGSVRRFNALFKSRYGLNPRRLRGRAPRAPGAADLALPAGIPSAAGVGSTARVPAPARHSGRRMGGRHALSAHGGDRRAPEAGSRVSLAKSGLALDVEMSPSLAPVIGAVIVRVKQLFDLGAAPDCGERPAVAGSDARRRGAPPAGIACAGRIRRIRTCGARRARPAGVGEGGDHDGRALGGRRSARPIATPYPAAQSARAAGAARMAGAPPRTRSRALGVVGSRARCLIALAHAVTERRVVLAHAANVEEQIDGCWSVAGHRPVDGAIHRHARAALARRLSRRGFDAASGRRDRQEGIAAARRSAGGPGAPMPRIIYGNHWGCFHELLHVSRKPDRPAAASLRRRGTDRPVHGRAGAPPSRRRAGAGGCETRIRCPRPCGSCEEYFAGPRREFDLPLRLAGHGISAARVAQPHGDPLRRNVELR